MKYLIDTHTFLWYNSGDNSLSKHAQNLITDSTNEIFVSIASLWEISIKTSLGKLNIAGSYEQIFEDITENSIEILPINFEHTVIQNQLTYHHRDPFDRMIISQAIAETMSIISKDEAFDNYLINRVIRREW
ncbi:MAG: type II toxin-antitoxin system VapC family toxin [Ignavibacteria bacterium]|nr:type II toxin-antitoxin system VapC family toxin [Ignavibacteria bacterium]